MSIHKDQAIKAEEIDLPETLFDDGQKLTPFTQLLTGEEYNMDRLAKVRSRIPANVIRFINTPHSGLTAP